MDTHYRGVIFTNHALERLHERGISQGDAWVTLRRADQTRYSSTKGAWVYYKTYKDKKIEVVAKQNEKKEWLVLSVWSKPVFEKARDGKKNVQKKKENIFTSVVKNLKYLVTGK